MNNNNQTENSSVKSIVIVGGGLIGATLLVALANKNKNVVLVDSTNLHQKITANFDPRALALSTASVRILQMLGVWSLLKEEATPISSIHISDKNHFGFTRLNSKEDEPFGYVVELQQVQEKLLQLIDPRYILAPATVTDIDKKQGFLTILKDDCPLTLQPKLIVAADGTDSTISRLLHLKARQRIFAEQAIVTHIELSRSHHNKAYERFTSEGPLALLPMTHNRMSVIWSLRPEKVKILMEAQEKEFLQNLQTAFGYRLGRFIKVGRRSIFPLREVNLEHQIAWPFVFVGNAAHTLHPIAAQGFNLGLRDVAALAQCIQHYGCKPGMLEKYEEMRRYDQQVIISATHALVKIFASQFPGLALLRNLGLITLDNCRMGKELLINHARGLAGIPPDLACGMKI